MGLDTIIVAFFVMGTVLVVAGALTTGTSNLVESSYHGYVSAHQTMMDRLQTSIEIQQPISFNISTNHASFTVANTGETKLSNFELWDIILVKDDQVFYLDDSQYSITAGTDFLNPGILDPHESIEIELLTDLTSSENFTVMIVTDNGIVSSARRQV
ncbi:flagellar protein FlaF [Methanosarcina hadiensis]|uniref:flagellar protein FlaF n=1 Tax=Methanosarcina hadiensis TaxID=3078083 RepID=UPI003977E2F1